VGGDERFEEREGVLVPRGGAIQHNAEEYDPHGFSILLRMQRDHFWYRGRHRFIRAALRNQLAAIGARSNTLAALDLGGGCGGWADYLLRYGPPFREVALADSSLDALRLARQAIAPAIRLYHVSIYDLPWNERWDVVFLLDVIEHLADDADALRSVARTLKPGGLIVVSVPALAAFWSYTDTLAGHYRRYTCDELTQLGSRAGLDVLDARYFMFVLSPLLWLSRKRAPKAETLTKEEMRRMSERDHRVPAAPVNVALAAAFGAETPLGLHVPFPWGTSALAVYRKQGRVGEGLKASL